MTAPALRWIARSLAAGMTAALATACANDAPLGPAARGAPPTSLAASPEEAVRGVDLTGCDNLRAPEGQRRSFHSYASGVQVYRWSGTSWVFVEPQATLYADAGGHGEVGQHYVGPTWRSNSGSTVVGAVSQRCTPTPNAIPWLLLGAVSSSGPGVFDGTTFIQRVNTTGGLAPAAPGSVVGETARVPYTAEYVFYRAQ